MMHKTLRPYLTTGVALGGAALIAVVPATPQLLGAGVDHGRRPVHQPVALTADGDILTPYADLLTNTANNVGGLFAGMLKFPVLTQLISDPAGSLAHIPDALVTLNTLLPSIDVTSSGIPIQLGAEVTPPLGSLLALIGPFVTVGDAVGQIFGQATNLGDPLGALTAIIGAPATLLDALLNGTSGIDVAGQSIPAFNGLLTGGQDFNHTFTVGQLVDLAGFGGKTIGDLADQTGLSDQSLASVLTGLLDLVGVGNPTISELADKAGLSDQSVADLTITLLNFLGIGNPTITGLADQLGLSGQSIATVLNEVLGQVGIGTDQSLTSLVMGLLNSVGFGANPSVGDLMIAGLNAAGMEHLSVTDLVASLLQDLGVGDPSLGSLLKLAVGAVAPGDPTITGLLEAVGLGNLTVGNLLTPLLDMLGVGDKSIADLINPLVNPNPGDNFTLGQVIINILQTENPSTGQNSDFTLSQLLQQIPVQPGSSQTYADLTLGELLNQAVVPPADPANPDPPLDPYAGQPIATVPWADFLASNLAMGMGAQTFKQLAAEQMGMELSPFECSAMGTLFPPLDCNRTLSSYMGTNNVEQTLGNLHADGHGIAGVPAGTPLTDVNLGQLVDATGQGDLHLSSIILGLNLTTPVSQILTGLGLDQVTVDQLITNGFPWLVNANLVSLLSSWGLNNLDVDTVIDRLGLNMTLTQMLNALGLDQVQLTDVVNDLLGGVPVSTLLNDLGLGNTTLETFLNNLLGGVYVGDLLNGLNLDNVHLDDVLTSLLGGVQVGPVLDSLGLDNVHLDSVIDDLLGGVTVGKILDDLGASDATVNNVLASLGLNDTDTLGVSVGHFFGLLPQMFYGVPQQIADALAGAAG